MCIYTKDCLYTSLYIRVYTFSFLQEESIAATSTLENISTSFTYLTKTKKIDTSRIKLALSCI